MALGLLHIIFSDLHFYFVALSTFGSHLANNREGIDNPFTALGQGLFGFYTGTLVPHLDTPTGLIPWFSKTEGNTYATVLHHPFLFKGKPTQAQETTEGFCRRSRRISGAVAGENQVKNSSK